MDKIALLKEVKAYIDETIAGRTRDGEGFLSALVNTIDTSREAEHKAMLRGTQDQREVAILEFILLHRNP